ncbi:hypothetical protein PEXP_000340 [Penicillium expansum]|nr:hypothetical protein PEXP_000340 [Penicillium expansum]
MVPDKSAYKHLDTAASQLTHILREAGINHIFFGDSPPAFLDTHVTIETSASRALSDIPEFTWCSDEKCWRYFYRNIHASIAISTPGSGPWNVLSPRAAERYTIDPRDVPDRSLFAKIDILHPSVLVLTKLKPWYNSEISRDISAYMRSRAHLMDIMSGLEWLTDEEIAD